MQNYNHKEVEKKWQIKWQENELFKTNKKDDTKEKFYLLDMFPYPSGSGLHMGHTEQAAVTDTLYRFYRMNGKNVLHPQGFDAFGLPAENFAIKTGTPPDQSTKEAMSTFKKQMQNLGLAYDFTGNITTSEPTYYKWTQFIFGKFFENDIAYKKTAKANWCSSCNTIIANEQIENGECERCGTVIEQKDVPSWMFRITDFADDLIWNDVELPRSSVSVPRPSATSSEVDWPEHTKKNQNAWIGKSAGAKIKFQIKYAGQYLNQDIEVFTTRPDTLFGATYTVLAPEHPLVQEFLKMDYLENAQEVREYIEESKKKTELERLENKKKTGVLLKGVTATNPVTEKAGMNGNVDLPIYISDYVLSGYGTGAIMAVPAHDERDYDFAEKFNLFIKPVFDLDVSNSISSGKYTGEINVECSIKQGPKIKLELLKGWFPKEKEKLTNIWKYLLQNNGEAPFCVIKDTTAFLRLTNKLINSGEFDGMDSEEAKKKITEFVGGELTSTYRLRDWSISRQRYWGCPIPIVYNPDGKAHYVGDQNLPWLLPTDVDFVPTGTAPLAKSQELKERVEKIFGEGWTPEVDTMDTFVDSSWYFLRYPDSENDTEFASEEMLKKWMPVDLYIGGAEHTYMHLLYARFFVKAMQKIGLVDFSEPFLKLRHQGMVNDEYGKKMSKSKGNVVNPDEMVERFGADATRTYMLFASPVEDDVVWNEDNIVGVYRFLEKAVRQSQKVSDNSSEGVTKFLHKTIASVTDKTEKLKFNTAISDMMKFINFLDKQGSISQKDFTDFVKILSPFAPHLAEELYSEFEEGFLVQKTWPKAEKKFLEDDTLEVIVQVNGKMRGKIQVPASASQDDAEEIAKKDQNIAKWLDGDIKKVIYVPGKILNFVI